MADELDERLAHRLADDAVGRDNVGDAEEREEDADAHDLQGLQHHVLAPKARQTFVPDRGEQLLDVRMSDELQHTSGVVNFLIGLWRCSQGIRELHGDQY